MGFLIGCSSDIGFDRLWFLLLLVGGLSELPLIRGGQADGR